MRQLAPLAFGLLLAACQAPASTETQSYALSTPLTACAKDSDCAAGDHCGDQKLCVTPNTEKGGPSADTGGGGGQDPGPGAGNDTGGGTNTESGGGTNTESGPGDGGAH